jgi:hypothetical protein
VHLPSPVLWMVDRHLFHAYPDAAFNFDADSDPEADPDPTSSFRNFGKSKFFCFYFT